jgi:hypothetical protein
VLVLLDGFFLVRIVSLRCALGYGHFSVPLFNVRMISL